VPLTAIALIVTPAAVYAVGLTPQETAPHPNAAKLFVEYILSKEGTDIFVVGESMYSVMKDYKPPVAAARPSLRHE
jgi:ABC-type Fe3+ transport system substrate-binding protein